MPESTAALITSPLGVMTVLCAVVAFWFWLEKWTRWKVFDYLPPLIFIYATPVFLSNSIVSDRSLIPLESDTYGFLRTYGLPAFIVLMLIKVDIVGAVRIMGKGVFVMLLGSVGVVLGGVASFALGQALPLGMPADSWKAFGTLAGSWIGGTGNMTAAHAALEGDAQHMAMAAVADQAVYLIWLPLLLGSKAFADRFNRWARVPADRIERMEAATAGHAVQDFAPAMTHVVALALLALGITWISGSLSTTLPPVEIGGQVVISASTWLILLVTTLALAASATPARRLPSSHSIAMAIIYVYVARIGATVDLGKLDLATAGAFVALAFLWISVHGAFVLAGAWFFKVDVHTLAIASAANIGGAASAPVVAAHHRQSLVPASILMAMIGYAVGNYLAILSGRLGQYLS